MKIFLVISILLTACTSHSQKESTAKSTKDTTSIAAPVNPYKNITFAYTKDLNCGMPISAGIGDTAHYKGKIYGFCSTECKDDFLKNPAAHLVAK